MNQIQTLILILLGLAASACGQNPENLITGNSDQLEGLDEGSASSKEFLKMQLPKIY